MPRRTRLFMVSWTISLLCLLLPGRSVLAEESLPNIRVGILTYQDISVAFEDYREILRQLGQSSARKADIGVAVGTYADVLHWLESGAIDLAIVTPAVYAFTLSPSWPNTAPRWNYLATFTTATGAPRLTYRSQALVPESSSIHSVADLRSKSAENRTRYLFVDPFSLSGNLAPLHALRLVGLRPDMKQVAYSYSHTNTLRLLASGEISPDTVAFVWDGALSAASQNQRLRILPFPELQSLDLPGDVIITRDGFTHDTLVRTLLNDPGNNRFLPVPEAESLYRNILSYVSGNVFSHSPYWNDDPRTKMVSPRDLGSLLVHHAHAHLTPPRIAVVLSGGGAKCSFQVGAMIAIEDMLEKARRDFNLPDLDISIVVGTSGGAINALAVSLLAAQTKENQIDYRQVWQNLDRTTIIRPTLAVQTNMGLWFALIQLFCLLLWNSLQKRSLSKINLLLLALLGLLELVPLLISLKPYSIFGRNTLFHNLWLWLSWGLPISGALLLFFSIASFIRWQIGFRTGNKSTDNKWGLGISLFGILTLPLLQAWVILYSNETISEKSGLENAIERSILSLANGQLSRRGQAPIVLEPQLSRAERLRTLSAEIINRDLIQRDLVLTASVLSQRDAELPSDIYFYHQVNRKQESPQFGRQGYPFQDWNSLLLDVVLGSGAVYPVFPARTLPNFPNSIAKVEIVDGSFSHRSPVEAAVRWGATHVILIEASTEESMPRGNLLKNFGAALNHLYESAQLVDLRSKEKVTMFTLVPQPPHIGLLDFSPNLIAQGIEKGYREVVGPAGDGTFPSIRKELGAPQFVAITASE